MSIIHLLSLKLYKKLMVAEEPLNSSLPIVRLEITYAKMAVEVTSPNIFVSY